MAENKMEQVAKLLGQELGKRFTVRYYGINFGCWFIGGTFEVIDASSPKQRVNEQVLYGLITGEAVIVDE